MFTKTNSNNYLRKLNLDMECDYYIDKNLYIYYDNNDYTLFNLRRIKGYYNLDFLYQNAYNYDKQLEEYKKEILNVYTEPIIIYNNNSFTKLNFYNKYEHIISLLLEREKKEWNEIKEVIKIEERYVR
jgi:hypothetical protein